jgi:hypothetical protein
MEEIRKLTAITLVHSAQQKLQRECYAEIKHDHSNECPLNIAINVVQSFGGASLRVISLDVFRYDPMYISYTIRGISNSDANHLHLEQVFGLTKTSDITLNFYFSGNARIIGIGCILFANSNCCILNTCGITIGLDYQKTVKSLLKFHAERPIHINRKIEFFIPIPSCLHTPQKFANSLR